MNTRMKETPEQRARRMQSFAEEGRVAPPDPAAEEPSVNEIYNPMLDAKCFNDQYHPPSVDKWELYEDYVKIFRWGFDNPPESPLHDFSTEVTNNRFPGFCLRMAFHDNAIDKGLDADEYIESNIDSNTGAWIGPDMLLESSGGDASVLTCKHERLHPVREVLVLLKKCWCQKLLATTSHCFVVFPSYYLRIKTTTRLLRESCMHSRALRASLMDRGLMAGHSCRSTVSRTQTLCTTVRWLQ